ncbi:MAG: hypothetical protein IJD94_05090 [Clostridia bacterium]|nr:hypothetical protein [Clostridia bacterium]
MENVESTAAIFGSMTVEEPAAETAIPAEDIASQLAENVENAQQGEAAPEGGEEHQEAQTEEDGAQNDASALHNTISAGLDELREDGWSDEELNAFAGDAQVIADLASGKSVARAANAFVRRQHTAAKAPAKKGALPITQGSATGGAMPKISMDEMTDAQFDAFSRRAQEAAMMGKRVRM